MRKPWAAAISAEASSVRSTARPTAISVSTRSPKGTCGPTGISAEPLGQGSRPGWWRPQIAEDYDPPACYECKGLARRSCKHCGSLYCNEHAGSAGLCAACHRSSWVGMLFLAGLLLCVVGLLIAGWWMVRS